jgi:trigger factor
MNTDVKKLPKAEIEVNVELTPEEFQNDIEKAVAEISKGVKISGFRPGKVPFDVLSQHVGKEMIINHALDYAIPRILTDIVKKENIAIIAKPKVEVVSTEPVKFKALAPVYPDVKVEGYKKVDIKKKDVKVGEKDINEAFENLKKRFVEWNEIEGPVKKGHKVEIDFEGFDEGGASLEGTKSKNHPLIIGENMMVPGFEDNLEGMKKGEEKDFTVVFPKDYHKESFQNKKVKFHVKINKIEEPVYPEINEKFIEKLTGKKTPVDEFKKSIEKDLLEFKQNEEKKRMENELLEGFLKVTETAFSDILVDEEVDFMMRQLKSDMAQKGLKFEDYLKYIKKSEDELRKEMRKEAIKRITLRFGLQEIMEKENIEVKEDEITAEMNKLPAVKPEEKNEMRGRIINNIRLSRLFDRFLQK